MITVSKEDYLKAILEAEAEGQSVISATLAHWLNVSAPAVTMALRRLKKDGMVRVAAIGGDAYHAVFLEAAQRHGHRGGGDVQPMRQRRRNDTLALGFGFKDGFEVILFGYGDHVWIAYNNFQLTVVNQMFLLVRDWVQYPDSEI